MADDLERELHSIKGEDPSPDFVANLRKRVAAELAQSIVVVDDEFVVDVDLRPNEKEHAMSKKRWMLMGAAAAVALIAGFVALSGGEDEDSLEDIIVADEPTPVPEATATPVPPTPTPVPAVPEPATFVADATLLTGEGNQVDPGSYRVDGVGTPFSFALEETLTVQRNNQGMLVLTAESSQGSDDRDIVFMRLTHLAEPTQPDLFGDLDDAWPADDFVGWLDNLGDGIAATNREETTLGGLDALRVDIAVDENACSDNPSLCVDFATNNAVTFKAMTGGSTFRVWMVDQADQDPLVVVVGITDEADLDWFTTTEELLATLVFGDISPNPIQPATAGFAEVPFLGGIRIELAEGQSVNQETVDFGRILFDKQPGAVELLFRPAEFDDNVLQTTDELVAVLLAHDIEAIEIGEMRIDGLDARIFTISGQSEDGVLKRNVDDDRGWRPPSLGQMWVMEHPERGLMMVTAESFGGPDVDVTFPLIVAQAEAILESLEYIELG